jgi:hypothetical protein
MEPALHVLLAPSAGAALAWPREWLAAQAGLAEAAAARPLALPARITAAAEWDACLERDADAAPVALAAAHRLGLRAIGALDVVAHAARQCAATARERAWLLLLPGPCWQRLERLGQGAWPRAVLHALPATEAPLEVKAVTEALGHVGAAPQATRFALAELLAHGELTAAELARVLCEEPAETELLLRGLAAEGLVARGEDGAWRVADAAHAALEAWLARSHLPT